MEVLARLVKARPDATALVDQIVDTIEAETAELDAQIQSGKHFALTGSSGSRVVHWFACPSVKSVLEREIAWAQRVEAVLKLRLRQPTATTEELLESVLTTAIGRLPDLASAAEVETGQYRVRPCGNCRPPFKVRTGLQHFGVSVRPSEFGEKLTRDTYAIISKKSSFPMNASAAALGEIPEWYAARFEDPPHYRTYSDEWCESQQERALRNFDLNMAFFQKLDAEAFDAELEQALAQHPEFVEIKDLNEVDGVRGVYVMVLDHHKQAYIGVSKDIRRRIRQHWVARKEFDRLIFGDVNSSVLSIDSFRALDTTRIFVAATKDTFRLEEKLVADFDPDFLLNRDAGGGNYMRLFIQMGTNTIKKRSLVDDQTV